MKKFHILEDPDVLFGRLQASPVLLKLESLNEIIDEIYTVGRVSGSCNQILSPGLGDKVGSGIRLSYRPARLRRLAGRYPTLSPPVNDNEFGYRFRINND